MKRELLQTVDSVVEALGGDDVVSSWLGVGRTAVCNWRARKCIPPGWHMPIWLTLQERGYRVDLDVFGLRDLPPLEDFRKRSRHVA